MGTVLHLCVASDYIAAQLRYKKRGLWKAKAEVVSSETIFKPYSESTDSAGLLDALSLSLQELKQSNIHPLARLAKLEMEVEVGARHARVGMLRMDSAVPLSGRDTLVSAWVTQTWNVDPTDHFVRYAELPRSKEQAHRDFLVSCIERALVRTIETACVAEKIRFVGCHPALLMHMNSWVDYTSAAAKRTGIPLDALTTVIFKERPFGGEKPGTVQLVGLQSGNLRFISRKWIGLSDSQSSPAELDPVAVGLLMEPSLQISPTSAPRTMVFEWPSPSGVSGGSMSAATSAMKANAQ